MKLTANIKLNPTKSEFFALKQTLETANIACNYISEIAFQRKIFNQFALHKIIYYPIKEKFNLSAQMTVRCIAKVADSYKINKTSQHIFKKHSAQPYDSRIFRLMKDNSISIWTIIGRQQIPFQCGEYQQNLIKNQHGEVDLLFIHGVFYIACVCDIDEDTIINPQNILGIDLGVVNIAVASNGTIYSGKKLDNYRQKINSRRANLQKKGTKSAKRKLKKLSGRQKRYQKDTNHCISKAIVTDAKRLSCSIALENLKGIRTSIKANRHGRGRLHNWSFYQLRQFITYKAQLFGVPITLVNPRNTSRECPICHHISKSNRKSQSKFICESCGFSHLADFVAALNIRAKGFVNSPIVPLNSTAGTNFQLLSGSS